MTPMTVSIAVNGKCNLRCRMCDIGQHAEGSGLGVNWRDRAELSVDEWRLRLDALRAAEVLIRGTEPLLYPGIDELLETLARSRRRVVLTTNGWLLAEHAKAVAAHCDWLSVSLDGHTAEIHDRIRGVPGSFDRAMEGLRLVRDEPKHPRIRVNLAVTPDNFSSLTDYCALFRDKLGLMATVTHYNYIHPASCAGYGCTPSGLSSYDLADIDVKVLTSQVAACHGRMEFIPDIPSAEQLRRWYHEPPTAVLAGHACPVLQRTWAHNLRTLASDGSVIISSRCWIDEAGHKDWPWRFRQAVYMLAGGLPPPCQRLCCAGRTV